ncbi:hypothetical protein EIN_184590 [Entamoeba invadens IP1]|uniref:hypothetical protein n=1 Tax=Entamoeba invadens IP1 TaxID=370355 RepID=UPI0002C3E82A|nr:hypothetical protein EIN_184590 [Entamoeba invadens IP1]ELP94102.1 hypothetical protein EIN_184590 [Entamoeba invadens IP1]|eukprot:XP_004260873.1 hypothetical protein EIN_184590 [Entamoeba invadens IP1]
MEVKELCLLQLLISEGLLRKVLTYLPLDDLSSFTQAYPFISQDTFIKKLVEKIVHVTGSIELFGSLKNRSWRSILTHISKNYKKQDFFLPRTANSFGLGYSNSLFINQNTNRNTRLVAKSIYPFEAADRMVCYCKSHGKYAILRTPLFYFEVEILPNASSHVIDEMIISIGFVSSKDYNEKRHVGWEGNSIGFHSDDGRVFKNSGMGEEFDRPYTSGDVIGAAFDVVKRAAFFTRNGKIVLNRMFYNLGFEQAYPAIGFSTCYSARVNFGEKPFLFDVFGYIENTK